MGIELGLTGTTRLTVAPEHTATAQGTGDVDVLSTSQLLQLMQQATIVALAGRLPAGMITAGLRVNLDHLHGTPVGSEVEATARITRIEGRRIIFDVEATSDGRLVGHGRVIRVQIDRDSFLDRIE